MTVNKDVEKLFSDNLVDFSDDSISLKKNVPNWAKKEFDILIDNLKKVYGGEHHGN